MIRCCLLAIAVMAGFGESAIACGRCGIFGRGCRYATKYVSPVVVQQEPSVQNFIFSNSFPVPYLAPAGNSVYGYSLAASAYNVDPSLYMDRAARFTELALDNGKAAVEGFNANALALTSASDAADRRQKNTVLALAAIEANRDSTPAASQSFRATIQGGKLSIERIEPAPPAGQASALSTPAPAGMQSCAKCHDGKGEHGEPKGIVLDGSVPLDAVAYRKSAAAVKAGKMPPQADWSDEQKLDAVSALADLLK
jgi:mono/diheme cytochrome c family protein